MTRILPEAVNPGPFNKKEHLLIGVLAGSGASGRSAAKGQRAPEETERLTTIFLVQLLTRERLSRYRICTTRPSWERLEDCCCCCPLS